MSDEMKPEWKSILETDLYDPGLKKSYVCDHCGQSLDLQRKLEETLELHRMHMASISVGAITNTKESHAHGRIDKSNSYWTLALQDVYDAVDREMELRRKLDIAERAMKNAKKCCMASSEECCLVDALKEIEK